MLRATTACTFWTQLTKVFRTSDASITLIASRHNGVRFPRVVRTNPRCFFNVFFKSPFGAPGWKPGAGACFLNPISAKFSPKNVRPQLFIFRPLFTYFRILILNKPWSQRISSEGTPLEIMFAIGWAQVVEATEAYWEPFLAWRLHTGFHSTVSSCKARDFFRLYGEHWNFERCILGGWMRMGLQKLSH